MKKIFFFAAMVALSLSISAQKQMHIWMNGGALKLAINKVDSVTFFDPSVSTPDDPNIPEPDPTPDPSTANGIGVFSVAEGKTVSFAPGNLQFNAARGSHLRADGSKAKGTWRFAENQWDYVGEANENIAEDYDGWIDLFCWGTSGYDNTANDPYAIFYQPWSNSTIHLSTIKLDSTLNCDMYDITGECVWEYTYLDASYNAYGYGPSTNMQQDVGIFATSAYYDWGIYNAISNGGNSPDIWRTLTTDEWEYLLRTRNNAQYLRSQGTVNGIKGYILLPDDFKKPADITWLHQANNWTSNTYTIEQWEKIETIGAIFLPASGWCRTIDGQEYDGGYWSSTGFDANIAYFLGFRIDEIKDGGRDRFDRRSVRLVQDIKKEVPETPETPEEPETPESPTDTIEPVVGMFSVAKGKQVIFSSGNLQYHPKNDKWRFAENQTDYIGDANSNISATYDGWIDLFGWGTGNNPTNTSTNSNDYYDFIDWGRNYIDNDVPNTWRTLNYSEWCYLRYDRANADSLCGIAQINGINGLILLPDNWNSVEGIAFKFGFNDKRTENYADYQTFTTEQWSKLESAGAIFLPVTGFRNITSISSIYDHGSYWSASCYDNQEAYYLQLNSRGAEMGNYDARYGGRGVRLVKDVQLDSIENSHEYVDLGLSVKWATCNIGATRPEETGDYFAWGETKSKEIYDWTTYKWCELTYFTDHYEAYITKYCTQSNCGYEGFRDYKDVLELEDDAANVIFGGNWRLPTKEEQDELREQCTWTWTTQNGINGYLVTSNVYGYTDKSIFLPATGSMEPTLSNTTYGYYWSSSLNTDSPYSACYIVFNSENVSNRDFRRTIGFPIRPVCP